MKKILFLFIVFISCSFYLSAEEYDVEAIYEKVDVNNDETIAIDNYGNSHEVDYLLVETSLKEGNYEVELTRKDSNLYRVEGTDIYIKTKYCYEYANRDDAILVVNYYSVKLIFLD